MKNLNKEEIQIFMNDNYPKYHHEISNVRQIANMIVFQCTKWNDDHELPPMSMYIDERSYKKGIASLYDGRYST